MIELEGMRRALVAASSAQLVIFVRDGSLKSQTEGNEAALKQVLEACHGVPLIAVANKVDLVEGRGGGGGDGVIIATVALGGSTAGKDLNWLSLSCKTGEGLQKLVDHMELVVRDRFESSSGEEDGETGAIITRKRHRLHIEKCRDFLESSLNPYLAMDLVAEELRGGITELGCITGVVDVEDVLDVIFRDFCIGE